MNFTSIFLQVLSLFLIILVGYVVRKRKIVGSTLKKDLAELIFYITLPALILASILSSAELYNSVSDIFIIILLSLLSYLVAFLIAFIYPKIMKTDEKNVGVYQFLLTFANVGFMGYPIVTVLFGAEMLFYAIIFVMPFNVIVFTLGVYYMTKGNSKVKVNLKTILNPGLLAVILALLLNFMNIKFSNTILNTVDIIGGLTTPLSMMMIGLSLASTKILSAFTNLKLYIVILFRLLIFPFIIYFIYNNFNISLDILKVGVILAAMPGAATAVIVAEKYECNSALASQGVVLSTLLSMFTIPIVALFLLQL
ncbi:AEC family transporter [Mycoplasmatota bacterium WC44]